MMVSMHEMKMFMQKMKRTNTENLDTIMRQFSTMRDGHAEDTNRIVRMFYKHQESQNKMIQEIKDHQKEQIDNLDKNLKSMRNQDMG